MKTVVAKTEGKADAEVEGMDVVVESMKVVVKV